MFQEISYDGAHGNIFAKTGNSCFQAADTTDDEVDLYAVLGSLVESVDHCWVLEGVHLEDDTSTLALVGKFYFTVDEAVQFGDEVEAGDKESREFGVFFTLQGAEEVV